jgi:hypothetical protein
MLPENSWAIVAMFGGGAAWASGAGAPETLSACAIANAAAHASTVRTPAINAGL